MIISVLVCAYNESSHISDCIRSAWQLTDDVLVLNMQSTDDTARKAMELGARVIDVQMSGYVEPVRQYGIEQSRGDWVLILDADERLTSPLAQEITQVLSKWSDTDPTHYMIPRKNIFGHTWLKHGGWYPDSQVRLIFRTALTLWPSRIHSTPQIRGPRGTLTQAFEHHFHGNLTQMVTKTANYETIEADLLKEAGRKANVLIFFRKYFGELFRRLVRYQGYRDGMMGWIESLYQAYSKTITYLFLYEKTNFHPNLSGGKGEQEPAQHRSDAHGAFVSHHT